MRPEIFSRIQFDLQRIKEKALIWDFFDCRDKAKEMRYGMRHWDETTPEKGD